jgi:hypothetical protein
MTEGVNVFLEATRRGLRFNAQNHLNLTTEQLWQLPLKTTRATESDLDGAGKIVKKLLREQDEDSIVESGANKAKAELELKLAVLVAIVEYKQAENAAKVAEASKQSEKARLKEILETKRADALGSLSVEEIEKRLAALG